MEYMNGIRRRKTVLEELASLLRSNGYSVDEQSEATLIYQYLVDLIESDDYEVYISDCIDEYNEILSIISIHNMPGDISKYFEKIITLYQDCDDYDEEYIYEATINIFGDILEHLHIGYGKEKKEEEEELELFELLGHLAINTESAETKEQIERAIGEAKREKQENKRKAYHAVLEYIKKQKLPVTRTNIKMNVPGSSNGIISSVVGNEKKILSFYGEYIWADNLSISRTDLQLIKSVLDGVVSFSNVHHIQEIYNAIKDRDRFVLGRNMIDTPHRLFSVCRYYFDYEYKFERPYVASMWTKIKTAGERIQDFVRGKSEVEIRDILNYARSNYMQIPSIIDVMADLNGSHLMGTKYKLVMIDWNNINRAKALVIEEKIRNEISDAGAKGIAALCCANELPDIGIEWDEWLIYSILRKWGSRVQVCTTSCRYTEAVPVVYVGKQPTDEQLEDIALDCRNRHLQMADNMDNIDELIEDMFDDIEF